MKFGKVDNPEDIDFTIPADHKDTLRVLKSSKGNEFEAFVGCAKWNKTDLKGFYPKGTKDELAYYSSHFNSIEMNATFYRLFPAEQFTTWKETVPAGFKFFPKLGQNISHWGRLKETEELVDAFVENVSHLGESLGVSFLQMHSNFAPKDFDRVKTFVKNWKYDIPVAVEFRHTDWYNNPEISAELYDLLEKHKIANVLVDTAGRRDLMHMRLTTPTAFIRYVGANHESDYARLDDWVERIAIWKNLGLREIGFFIHQNIEKESPLLATYFIEKLNKKIGTNLTIPKTLS
jgi:uncharacterized protein YecE (DUF72 family)